MLRHPDLAQTTPNQVHGAETQRPGVDRQRARHNLHAQRRDHAKQQGQRVHRINNKHAAQAIGLIGEWLQNLGAVNGGQVEQGVGDQCQHERPPPAAKQLSLLVYAAHHPRHGNSKQQQQQRRMRFAPVTHHIQNRVAMAKQHVKVRQQARHAAP